ncbi:MAG: TetR/AcrR family transcriptional regulator [Acidimicrobiales bacterium]
MGTADADGRLLRGQQTRAAILRHAVDLASVEGLEALTVRRLAADLSLSKSGVFAHFGSKEDLQLAVVAAAGEVFSERVVVPAAKAAPGRQRLLALLDRWLDYAREPVFPGGCFFFAVAAEFDARPGRVRDAITVARRAWLTVYEEAIRDAIEAGELGPETDAGQLAFEIDALAMAANSAAVLGDEAGAFERARRAVLARLQAASPDTKLRVLGESEGAGREAGRA